MRHRATIARALANQPPIMPMDEPFGALDAQTREALQNELLTIWQNTRTTIVFVTHGRSTKPDDRGRDRHSGGASRAARAAH
jgi:ABC-type nitrate/sulfonate/bicarbonate transport system ATPase subunit